MSSASQKARWNRIMRTRENLTDLEKMRFAARREAMEAAKRKAETEAKKKDEREKSNGSV